MSTSAPFTSPDDYRALIDAARHDLRNSLSAIRLGVELIGRRERSHDLAGVLAHVDSAALRAHEYSEVLADVCTLAAGHRIATATMRFSVHAVVRQTIDATPRSEALPVFEHDRFGEGDCIGDPARIAQFLTLALEELAVAAAPTSVIVISEVAGERFRVTVLGDRRRTTTAQCSEVAPALSATRRRVLMRGIASAHQGQVEFDRVRAGGVAVEGRFVSVCRPSP